MLSVGSLIVVIVIIKIMICKDVKTENKVGSVLSYMKKCVVDYSEAFYSSYMVRSFLRALREQTTQSFLLRFFGRAL